MRRTQSLVFGYLPISLLAPVLVSGCALFKDPVPPRFDAIHIRGEVRTDRGGELKGDTHADTTIKGALIGAGGGAVTGATAGGAIGLTCGPIAVVVCVPAGMVLGGAGGGMVGMVAGGIGGLPWRTAGEVNERLAHLQRTREFPEEVRSAVATAVPDEIQAPVEEADAIVTARLDKVDLRQHWSERLSFRMWASMTQEWDRDSAEPKTNTCKYVYTTPKADVEDWLLDGGFAFGEAFTGSIDTFARWMARDLEAFATRTPQPKSDDAPETCFQD